MPPVLIANDSLRNRIYSEYLNPVRLISKWTKVKITGKSKAKSSLGVVRGFPNKYLDVLMEMIRRNVKPMIDENNHVSFRITKSGLSDFFNGKVAGAEVMRFIEHGRKKSKNFFFFSVNMQRVFARFVNAKPTTKPRKVAFTKFGRPTRTKDRYRRRIRKRKSRREFEIRRGRSGAGIMGKWNNFSKGGKDILLKIYGGRQPFHPGFKGLELLNKLIIVLNSSEFLDFINKDPMIKKSSFEVSRSNILISEINFGKRQMVGTIETDTRKSKFIGKLNVSEKQVSNIIKRAFLKGLK